MTYEDVKRIRENPTADSVDNAELAAHSKKHRVRVKNIKKILRYYYELADIEF